MNRRIVTAAILCGIFLVAMDIFVVSPAMPVIVDDLGGLSYYAWVLAIYVLASTVTVPIYGKLTDMYGRKPVYLVGMGLFLLGSVGAGASVSMEMLIASRAIQGLGGGGMIPVTLTIVADLYPLKERARIQAVFSSVWGVASVIGPLIGGTLVDQGENGWRLIFYINLPFGVLAAFLMHRFLEEPDLERRPRAVPYLGAVLLGATILALLLGLLLPGMGYGWTSPWVIGLLALSPVFLAAFVTSDRRAREPIFDASLLRMRMFLACNISGFFASATLNGAAAFIPLFVHAVMGGTATAAGFALTPMSVGWVIAAFLAGKLILRIGYRVVAITGLSLLAAGALLITTIGLETRYVSILLYMFTMGAGLGFSFTAFLIATQNSVRRDQVSQATAGLHLLRQMGTVVGMAVLGAILMATLPPGLREESGGIPLHEIKEQITEQAVALRGPIAASIRAILVGGAAFALAALVAGLFVPGGVAEKHVREEEGA